MHQCSTCARSFANKSALTRHEHNHHKTRPYVCSICNVAFYRNDLLKRHARMHSQVPESGDHDDDPSELGKSGRASPKRRIRTRTACSACRTAKAKCDGSVPCQRCVDLGKECVFANASGRVSTDLRLAVPSSGTLSPPQTEPSISNESFTRDSTEPAKSLDSLTEQPDEPRFVNALPMHNAGQHDSFDTRIFDDGNFAGAWSYVHENMFLQGSWGGDMSMGVVSGNQQPLPDGIIWGVPPVQAPVTSSSQSFSDSVKTKASAVIEAPENVSQEHRNGLIVRLVQKAVNAVEMAIKQPHRKHLSREQFYNEVQEICPELEASFGLRRGIAGNYGSDQSTSHCIDEFVVLYLEHFWTLWPLFPRYGCFGFREYQPLLYLTLVSIGTMYENKQAGYFGSLLHNQLRDALIKPWFDNVVSDTEAISLGQARSLTQAAALYFGQKRAFSYAQHIGAVLLSQARRMGIFSQGTKISGHARVPFSNTAKDLVQTWVKDESRKRLSYAVLRLEMYSSALRSVRPLISAEEMDVELPCSRLLWQTNFDSITAFAAAIEQERLQNQPKPLFSDLVRIAVDENEKLPALGHLEQELLLNALQEKVWIAVVARASLGRLTPVKDEFNVFLDSGFDDIHNANNRAPTMSYMDVAGADSSMPVTNKWLEMRHPRVMSSLSIRTMAITSALRKWQACCFRSMQVVPETLPDRSSLLSCLLIYHLSFLQLHAPIDLIHTLYHQKPKTPASSESHAVYKSIMAWIMTERAHVALLHSMEIYSLLSNEASKDKFSRARVNFLSMIGLYHCAALVWIYAIVSGNSELAPELQLGSGRTIAVTESNTSDLMSAFAALFDLVSPAWAARSSFCSAVKRLKTLRLADDGSGSIVEV